MSVVCFWGRKHPTLTTLYCLNRKGVPNDVGEVGGGKSYRILQAKTQNPGFHCKHIWKSLKGTKQGSDDI